jgi:hypothetical protein
MRENQQNFAIKLENYKNPGDIVSGLGSARESGEVSSIKDSPVQSENSGIRTLGSGLGNIFGWSSQVIFSQFTG